MSDSRSLWRLDRDQLTGVGWEQWLLDQDKGGAVEKMGAEFEDKQSGRSSELDKGFAFAPATYPHQSITSWASTMARVALVQCPTCRSISSSWCRWSGQPPREVHFGVRALLKDTGTRYSWPSPGPWGWTFAHPVTVPCFSDIIFHVLLLLPPMPWWAEIQSVTEKCWSLVYNITLTWIPCWLYWRQKCWQFTGAISQLL